MKNYILCILLVLACSNFASAMALKDLTCFTGGHLTTSFSLNSNEANNFQLTVNHHNGVIYAPIHIGIITSNDIDHLKLKSDVIIKLGANYKINFNGANCRFQEDFISCSSRKNVRVNDLDVKSYSFSLIKETRISPFGEYRSWLAHVNVMRQEDSFIYNSVTRYQASECFINKK